MIPCPDDGAETKAKADRVERHRQLLRQDMVENPTTLEKCSEYPGSSFKPHFVVESQQEIERLRALTHQPSRMWAQAVQRYATPGFSNQLSGRGILEEVCRKHHVERVPGQVTKTRTRCCHYFIFADMQSLLGLRLLFGNVKVLATESLGYYVRLYRYVPRSAMFILVFGPSAVGTT